MKVCLFILGLLSYYVCHIRHKKRTAVENEAGIQQILETVNYVPILVAFVLITGQPHSKRPETHLTFIKSQSDVWSLTSANIAVITKITLQIKTSLLQLSST